jgi:transcription elongation factor GreB
MSKAFTKENDGDDGDDDGRSPELQIPKGSKNYITPEGAEKLKAELKQLLHHDRPELVKVIQWAASNGDRSENGDYIYGKRRLREIDRRIRFLSKRLESVEIVDPAARAMQTVDRVLFGATVTIGEEDGSTKVIKIVGVDESEPGRGRVSWISPIARSLMNSKVGDVVVLKTPQGERDLEVLKVQYL